MVGSLSKHTSVHGACLPGSPRRRHSPRGSQQGEEQMCTVSAHRARRRDGVPSVTICQPSQQACEMFLATWRPRTREAARWGRVSRGPQPVAGQSWVCSPCSSRCRLGDAQGMLRHDRHALLHTSCASTKPTPGKTAAPVLQPSGTWRPELPPSITAAEVAAGDRLVALGASPKLSSLTR